MTIPGLFAPVAGFVVGIDTSTNTPLDLAAAFGNPVGAINYRLFVSTSAVQGSTTIGVPAVDATGLHEDSVGLWVVDGTIVGRGGKGASITTVGTSTFYSFSPGGGGGGAGASVGAGGTVPKPGPPSGDATDGSPGLLLTGGAPGVNNTNAYSADAPTAGEDGGDAVWTNHAITAVVDGGVRGGGGGGGYTVLTPDFGGDLDQPGFGGSFFGAAGLGVKLIGAKATFSFSGSGTVGAVST